MMQAAQLAAQAAMAEAEASASYHQPDRHPHDESMSDLQESNPSMDMDQSQLALLEALQSGEMGESGDNLMEDIDMMGLDQNSLMQMLRKQQQELSRPDEHYLTIAQNGTILEATKTITGFLPDDLLMTSVYDAVYEDDVPGLLAVKSHFWDRGHPDVEAYIRRRTVEGHWIWLVTKAVSYVKQPIPGIILVERAVEDEYSATIVNRITRIAAILVQAVEAAQIVSINQDDEKDRYSENASVDSGSQIPLVAGDLEALDEMRAAGVEPDIDDNWLQLMRSAAAKGAINKGQSANQLEQEIFEKLSGKKKDIFDPFNLIEDVREGVRLDFGMIKLSASELRLIVLTMVGRLHVDDLCTVVFNALGSGCGLEIALEHHFSHNHHNGTPGSLHSGPSIRPPPISVLCLSYTYIGHASVQLLSEVIEARDSQLRTLDLSFCGLQDSGCQAVATSITRRKTSGTAPLRGVILSGNHMTRTSAKALGHALSPSLYRDNISRKRQHNHEASETQECRAADSYYSEEFGLLVLHLGSCFKHADLVAEFLRCLGPDSPIKELSLTSNCIGAEGVKYLLEILDGKGLPPGTAVLPHLDRLDVSDNKLEDEGLAAMTKAIAKRKTKVVEVRLSNNGIAHGGIEEMIGKLLGHDLVSLVLDKNNIGDQGCQLIAGSVRTMRSLARLNLSFNQIGSRGVNSLMRSLVGCESITYLGLSGNIMKISGAVALAFTLAQHPRLEELDADNCCLSQAAQCHIIAGIISNRWVPMKRMNGFDAGPPMVALGALQMAAQNLTNEECFRIKKDEQMKTILHWMETNRRRKQAGEGQNAGRGNSRHEYLTPDSVQTMNDEQGAPSQNAYVRLLAWLSRIPFDEDELLSLRKYFYDSEGGSDDKGSDAMLDLRLLRGDLLAPLLDSDEADEMCDDAAMLSQYDASVGKDIEKLQSTSIDHPWSYMKGVAFEKQQVLYSPHAQPLREAEDLSNRDVSEGEMDSSEIRDTVRDLDRPVRAHSSNSRSSMETTSRNSMRSIDSASEDPSTASHSERKRNQGMVKARITMFPQFEDKLEELKAKATDLIGEEALREDLEQQEIILTQYAEASLTILRQLRYHCMNSGLDGWRQGSVKRKALIIDDSIVTRKLIKKAFQKAEFIVDTASNGAEGVELLKSSIYDIAFMDLDMPVMNGFEATRKLREWEDAMRPQCRQPICALTAAYVDRFDQEELKRCKDAGLDVMESKPCNIPRLFKVVDDVSPFFSDLRLTADPLHQNEADDGAMS